MFNKEKKHFRKKLDGVQRMIYDLQFKVAKTRSIREDVRGEYDNAKSKLATVDNQITSQKKNKTMEEGEIKRLDDQKVLLEQDVVRHKGQMEQLDVEVNGAKPTADNPEGFQGISEQIDALYELKGMLKEYIKGL